MSRELPSPRPRVSRLLLALAGLGVLAGCAQGPDAGGDGIVASHAFINGNVVTVNDDFEVVEAFAINEGKFVAVGSTDDVLERVSADVEIVDLQGRTVLPGFNDNHIHMDLDLQDWEAGTMVPSSYTWTVNISTMDDLKAAIAKKVAETPAGEWIRGSLNCPDWPNNRVPTRWQLDELSPDNPIILTRGPHTFLVNSVVLELAGIDHDTPDPEGGWIFRDEHGEPNGRVLEAARRLVNRVAPRSSFGGRNPGDRLKQMRVNLQDLASLGITSVNIAGVRPSGIRQMQTLYDRWGAELPRATMQVRLSPGHDTYDDTEVGIRTEIAALEALGFYTGFGDDRLKIGAIKMSIDGGLSAPVFWSLEDYKDKPGFRGAIRIPADTFYPVARRAHELGWQLGIHAIGDGAVKMVAEQMSKILTEQPRDDHRHYMHHVSVKPPDETIELMARNNIMVASQPAFTVGLGAYAHEALTKDREATQNPTRSLQDKGIVVSHGSDSAPYGPLLTLWTAVTRIGFDGKVHGPEEAVSLEEAIRLHTVAPAYFNFDEEVKGQIREGMLADWVVLSENILEMPPEQIRDIEVLETVIGGTEVRSQMN
jgi:hypothetical protein